MRFPPQVRAGDRQVREGVRRGARDPQEPVHAGAGEMGSDRRH